eukprot:7741746-Pyramimonas_sp.AAC.1
MGDFQSRLAEPASEIHRRAKTRERAYKDQPPPRCRNKQDVRQRGENASVLTFTSKEPCC